MPRVSFSSVSKPLPDRLEDAIEVARQAAKLTGRHGVEGRLLAADTAGEQTGMMVFTVDFESIDRYAALIEEVDADKEIQELRISLTRSTSPIVMLAASLSTEIPLAGTRKPGRGTVVEVHLMSVSPGRFEAAIGDLSKAAGLLEKAGAVNVQAFQLGFAGMQSGQIGLAAEWTSVKAQALSGNVWANDPVGLELAGAMMNGTSSTTLLSSALYRDIPL